MEKYGTAIQATDDAIIWCMHIACWITKVTNTHSEYCFSKAIKVPNSDLLQHITDTVSHFYMISLNMHTVSY